MKTPLLALLAAVLLSGCATDRPVPVIAVPIPKTEAITKSIKALRAPIANTRKSTDETIKAAEAVREAEKQLNLPDESPLALATITLEAKARAAAQFAIEAEVKYTDVVKENTLLNQDVEKSKVIAVKAQQQAAQFQADKLDAERSVSKWRKRALLAWSLIGGTIGLLVLWLLYGTAIRAAVAGAKL